MTEQILKFVPPNYSNNAAVLVIESEKYLAELRQLMPAAQIALLTSDKTPKLVEVCKKFSADIITGNLPTAPKIFDVIISEDCLKYGENFYRKLAELNHLLKDCGFVLTQFLNVRFIGVLEGLRRGIFSAKEERFWAKWDVVKILKDANFKEINFLPGEQIKISADEWENFGFDNFNNDLTTKIWLVKASKCAPEVVALKELYTEEIRAELSRRLHRVEYDIDAEKNLAAILELCRREKIFDDYLADFIDQTVVHKEKIFSLLPHLNR